MSDEQQKPNGNLKRIGIGAGVVALAAVAFGIATRSGADAELERTASDAAVPTVAVLQLGAPVAKADGAAGAVSAAGGLVLPGDVQAYNSAPIYARTNGYVRRWLVDIGDTVRAGQPLAILDAPNVDQQLAQARADYQTAVAQQKLAQSTSVRWAAMLAKDAVSRQEADEKAGAYAATSAVANAQAANVKRLVALQGFSRLSAPFAGIVTSRSAQIGALVVAGNAAAQPLFTVADVHRMRIYIRVPQAVSGQIRPGLQATMSLPEYPGRSFDAVLTRSAGAVDGQSGTVLIQLLADNTDGALKPGAYAQVSFPISGAAGGMRVPASALMFRDKTPTVATVDAKGRVTIKTVTIGRDEGSTVEITTGLTGQERIVDSPPDAIDTGDLVKAVAAKPAEKTPNAK